MRTLVVETGSWRDVHGTEGDDLIKVYGDVVIAYGGAGNDLIINYGDNGRIHDGAGDDICYNASVDADVLDSAGNDLYVFEEVPYPVPYYVFYDDAQQSIYARLGAGVVRGAEIGRDKLVGTYQFFSGAGDDEITGSRQTDMVYGHHGNDLIRGHNGHDLLRGDHGNDTILGGAGNDEIGGGGGNNELSGDDGDDVIGALEATTSVISGGEGNDILAGSTRGDDTIDGGAGNDTIRAGLGGDEMTGGAGADLFAFVLKRHANDNATEDYDTIFDFVDGEDKFGGGFTLRQVEQYGIDTLHGLFVELPDASGGVFIHGISKAQIDADDFLN